MEENHFQLWLICNHHKDINWFTALTKCVWTIFHLVNIWQLIYSTYAKFRCSVVTYVLYLRWTGNEHESLKWIGHSHCLSKFLSMLFFCFSFSKKNVKHHKQKSLCPNKKHKQNQRMATVATSVFDPFITMYRDVTRWLSFKNWRKNAKLSN